MSAAMINVGLMRETNSQFETRRLMPTLVLRVLQRGAPGNGSANGKAREFSAIRR